jgi:hypothetical protein
MLSNPPVTCLQLSYGRPHLSVEAVESFLRQTYENKRLIIVNTHHSPVYFKRIYGNIKIYNVGAFPYLSDVYRYGLSLIKTKHFFIWDDDDIFLPWHIADRVNAKLANPSFNAITHKVAFISYENQIKSLESNMFVSQYLYDNNGIVPDAGISCWDVNWDQKSWKRHYLSLPHARPSYIYRWATGESHISGSTTEKGQHQNYLKNIAEKKKIHFPDPWIPAWRRNYSLDATDYLKKHNIHFK